MLGMLLTSLGDSGQFDLVMKVIKSLHQGAYGFPADAQHFAIVLQALAKAKDVARGEDLYDLIKDKHDFCLNPFVVGSMLSLFGSSKESMSKAKGIFSLALAENKVWLISHVVNHVNFIVF